MAEISANHHHRPPPPPPATRSSRLAVRGGMGEIVEVEGGHIVRSTGRKDRHSKVCTAKGPRDRRVRLSAHTAIQFYDVQDRLGYDRPSKAVDWLIKNAKSAIDELAKLPPWNPNNTTVNRNPQEEQEREQNQIVDEIPIGVMERFDEIEVEIENPNRGNRLDFLAPNFDTDIIADSIKSFFPIGVSETNSPPPSIHQFQNYSPDLISRDSSNSSVCQNNQDLLRLSLQSLQQQQDPILLHQPQNHHHHHQNEELFPATTSVEFHGASFPDEHDRFHRMIAWNATNTGNNCHGGGGFIFNSTSPSPMPTLFGQSQCFSSQRGPLQSSNSPLLRAWIDSSIAAVIPDHQHHYLPQTFHNQSLIYGGGGGGGFDSGVFSGFRIPARIQGEEEYDGVSDKPSSASSDSRY